MINIKEIPESVSPISVSNISFSNIAEDIGPIPPPRMFSDAIISVLQAADVEEELSEQSGPEAHLNVESSDNGENGGDVKSLIAQINELVMGSYQNGDGYTYDEYYPYEYDEWSSPLVEEVLAKEPQLSAIPKKSALKKPKVVNNVPSENSGTTAAAADSRGGFSANIVNG